MGANPIQGVKRKANIEERADEVVGLKGIG